MLGPNYDTISASLLFIVSFPPLLPVNRFVVIVVGFVCFFVRLFVFSRVVYCSLYLSVYSFCGFVVFIVLLRLCLSVPLTHLSRTEIWCKSVISISRGKKKKREREKKKKKKEKKTKQTKAKVLTDMTSLTTRPNKPRRTISECPARTKKDS